MTEAPKFEGPLSNPDLTPEENLRLDKLMDTQTAEAARRFVLGHSTEPQQAEEIAPQTSSHVLDKSHSLTASKRIDRPSRNHRIYDRDKTVESLYGKPGEIQ